MIYFNYLTQ